MSAPETVSLDDKFDVTKDRIFVTGTQAIVRLALMQKARDKAAGLNTAGYVTGYRGSPLGAVDQQMWKAKSWLKDAEVVFQPAINEDLAATACWGTQQAHLRGENRYDGVYAMWYGKGPGVDRSGDVLRHGNLAGTAPHGGVLVLMGDDHTCESSTTAHQSDYALVDAMIPILYPCGVQEIVDYGLIGWALSRFAGTWAGLKLVKDTVDATASIEVHAERLNLVYPEVDQPANGLHIEAFEMPIEQEARLHDYRLPAVRAFARANRLDKTVFKGGATPRLGIVTAGKSYLDVRQALDDLGIDEVKAANLGIALYKVAMPWPLEPEGVREFALGLDKLIVVEEKRSLIEWQLKDALYGRTGAPQVVGKQDEEGRVLLPAKDALNPNMVALAIADRVLEYADDAAIRARADEIRKAEAARTGIAEIATRTPYFCAGCPHNSSTKVPEGSRAYAGIGCHWMVQLMPERNTIGYTQMGGEGANWIGEAPFSKTAHVFQNLGDGTYNHSGIMALRAAVAAGVNVTYKILYNDAVAMTGGQPNDGGLTVDMIVRQVLAEGAKRVRVVSDEPHKYPKGFFPAEVDISGRDDLDAVQTSLRDIPGVTVLVYDQTCAAEKRRRRKRGTFPDPDKRVVINDLVCEGCGDCGVQSNCVAVAPLETEFGRKRTIDQSACNKDFSCLKGFCPSFVTVEGGKLKKGKAIAGADADGFPTLPEPALPADSRQSIVVTGIGGTGVVTIGALVGMAAHLEGKGCGVLDMAGLAQKGGAVVSHIRLAESADEIQAIRVAAGGADVLLGCDIVVAGSTGVQATLKPGHTQAVVNTQKTMTGAFTQNADFDLPTARIEKQLGDMLGEGRTHLVPATPLATRLMGDSIATNLFMLGFAWQQGLIALKRSSIEEAIRLNGVAVEANLKAFLWGRRAAHDLAAVEKLAAPAPAAGASTAIARTLDDVIARRAEFLTGYQSRRYARRYEALVAKVREKEKALGLGEALTDAVARSLFKLMAYKDEYEVARLYTDGSFEARIADMFEGDYALKFHLAPPIMAKRDGNGRLVKREYGPSMMRTFRLLAKMKRLRGTPFDIFGRTAERKMERQLIRDYEKLVADILGALDARTHATAVALARLPQQIRGFGHVKEAALERVRAEEAKLRARLTERTPDPASMAEAAE